MQATVSRSICSIDGDLYYGAPATLYWEGMTARGPSNYTWCTIQGSHSTPEPVYGSTSGTAYHDTAFTIYVVLSDGSSYHLDGNLVNIIGGNDIQGAPCTVYYTDYPSKANIYQIDVYGYDSSPVQENATFGTYGYETDNVVYEGDQGYQTHISYNADGSTYEAIWCPDCGSEVSLAMDHCPVCFHSFI